MNLSVMPNVNSAKSNNQIGFKGGFAEFNGVWKDMLKGGKVVSADSFMHEKPIMLELSGAGSKLENLLPSKTFVVKQKLALIGEDKEEFQSLVATKSADLRVFLNKFFAGEFRLTDSKKMYINNLTEGKMVGEAKDIQLNPAYLRTHSA